MRTSQKWALGGTLGIATFLLVGLAAGVGSGRSRALMVSKVCAPLLLDAGARNQVQETEGQARQAPPPGASLGIPALETLAASQRLIRSGSITLEVPAFDAALGRVQAIAGARGGYIADLRANRPGKGKAQGTLTVRVLPAQYFAALDDFRALGKVESEGLQTQDVTKAYADLEARLRNKREMEARMREILRTRTGKLSDVIEAEQQLFQVTEEIERLEGERRYYQQMTGLSAITLDLHEPYAAAPEPPKPQPFFEPVRQAFQKSGELVMETLAVFILGAAALGPWIALGLLAWWLIRRFRRPAPVALPPA